MHSIAGDWGYDTKYRTEFSLSLFGITGTPSVSALAVRCLPLPSQLRAVFVRARCVCGVCV